VLERDDQRIDALGSGSDYTPFLQHLGIASLNIGFGGEDGGGSYHSIYDSFEHYTRFGDPGFAYGVALSKVGGRMTLRLANADLLPFNFTNFQDTVGTYASEVTKLADNMRDETRISNRLISSGMLEAAQDPTKTFVVPRTKLDVPYLNFAPLQNALAKLSDSVKAYNSVSAGKQLAPATQKQLDEILFRSERTLTSDSGLPRRDWFKHQIYAPGFYTGYGVKTLPGIREAIEQRNWSEAQEQINITAGVIEKFSGQIDRAAGLYR
jgi:N-acetylated-alpha-linked acidic dipeptidase